MRRIVKNTWLMASLVLVCSAVAGCQGGDITVTNETDFYLHIDHPEIPGTYMPPHSSATWTISMAREMKISYAPGQGVTGTVVTLFPECCEGSCGDIRAWADNGYLRGSAKAQYCPDDDSSSSSGSSTGGGGGGSDDDEEGSCPYVYAHDGKRFVLVGEGLVGALNRGAQRTDVLLMPGLRRHRGQYKIRVAAVLPETDYVDRVRLRLVDHPRGTRVVPDSAGRLYTVTGEIAPTRALSADRQDLRRALATEDSRRWKGKNLTSTLTPWGKHRDWVTVDFPRPAPGTEVVLLVRGRNTQFIQDTYHRYMAQFGGGTKTAMRLASDLAFYPMLIEELMRQGGFGIEVALDGGWQWQTLGEVSAVGPAGLRTVAVPLKIPPVKKGLLSGNSKTIRLRLAMMPGGWELDSVRLATVQKNRPRSTVVLPTSATWGKRKGKAFGVSLETLLWIDDRRARMAHGHQLTVAFGAPPPPKHRAQTVVLDLTGYYEERPSQKRKYELGLGELLVSMLDAEDFTRFVLGKIIGE
jgi:hypothetical protein